MTLWKETTNVLPADGVTVWIRRFPGIEHPKQALFSAATTDAPTFTVTVNAPDTSHPVTLVIPAHFVHSWRPTTGGAPGPGQCQPQSGAGSPIGTATPAYVGQLYHDTTADAYYRSTAMTIADWTPITSGSTGWPILTIPDTTLQAINLLGSATLTQLLTTALGTVTEGINIQNNPLLTTITLPYLTDSPGMLVLSGNASLTTVDLSLFETPGDILAISANPALATLSLPQLTTSPIGWDFSTNTLLTTLDLPVWIPVDGQFYDARTGSLSISSVEALLAQFVAAGVTTSTIDLSGGANAGLTSLSPAAQANAATLGPQLTINP